MAIIEWCVQNAPVCDKRKSKETDLKAIRFRRGAKWGNTSNESDCFWITELRLQSCITS